MGSELAAWVLGGALALGAPGTSRFGQALGAAGDLDGDGAADLVIGELEPHAGSGGSLLWVVSGADGRPLRRIDPGFACAAAGALAVVGDVDGDGRADVAVAGVPRGGARRVVRLVSLATGAVLRELGTEGSSLGAVGDVDGDDYPDLAVGAPWALRGVFLAGRVAVVSGRTGRELFVRRGDPLRPILGRRVGAAGDADGDGTPDLFVTAEPADEEESACRVLVLSGRDGRVIAEHATVQNGHRYPDLAANVAAAGDANGDGRVDLLIGEPAGFLAGARGRARVVSGSDGATLVELVGSDTTSSFGACVAAGGDLDGDGAREWLVGGSNDDAVWAFSGRDGARLYEVHEPWGEISYGIGGALCVLGDVDGDGADDWAASAFTHMAVGAEHPVSVVSGRTGARRWRVTRAALEAAWGR